VSNDRADLEQILSRAFGRDIAFVEARAEGMTSGVAEEYWPDMSGLEHRDTVTDFEMPAGTFFDNAVVHLLTTSTINRLRELYPQGRFEARRFRPNIVVSTGSEDAGFVENDWIGRTVVIGDTVRLAITEPCPRCVMITLPQGDLPKDSGILRTAAQHNAVNVGVYASVVSGGTTSNAAPAARSSPCGPSPPSTSALRVPKTSSALVTGDSIITKRSCPGQPFNAHRIADGDWAMMLGRATSTGLPRRDQRAGDAPAAARERPRQGRRNPRPAPPDRGPRTTAARPEGPVHPC
jgi:MOSC domain